MLGLTTNKGSAVLVLLIVAFRLVTSSLAAAQEPDIEKLRKAADEKTNEYVQKALRRMQEKGDCEPLPEGYVLVAKGALANIDPKALGAALERLTGQIQDLEKSKAEEENTLTQLKNQQKEAVFDWMLKEMFKQPGLIGPGDKTELGVHVTVIKPTLFGSFVQLYDKPIRAGGKGELKVIFTPAATVSGTLHAVPRRWL